MVNSDVKTTRKFALLTIAAVLVGHFALPLLLTSSMAYSSPATNPPPNHEITGSCSNLTTNCGHVICGSNSASKLPAALIVNVLYNKNGILGGQIEIVNSLVVPPATPNPFLYGTVLSVSKIGSGFTLKGIIGDQLPYASCGKTAPQLPTPFTLTGTCGFKTTVTFKANDGIKGTFTANVACV